MTWLSGFLDKAEEMEGNMAVFVDIFGVKELDVE